MFSTCKVQLIQPRAGLKPGADFSTEKWLICKLHLGGMIEKLPNQAEIFNSLTEYPVSGKYFIDSNNMTPGDNNGYYIGSTAPPEVKFWRYNPASLTLFFVTMETWTGGGAMSNEPNPTVISDDLVLYNARFTANGIKTLFNADYQTGFVNVKSPIQPFEKRVIYWSDAPNFS
jgi:hypothetical protein